MELDELLEREGQDPDELMTWAQTRVEQLLAELVGQSDELARLLEPAAQINLDAVPVRRVAVAEDLVSAAPTAAAPKPEIIEVAEPSRPIELAETDGEPDDVETAEAGPRGRRRVPSTPQPLSADELPPPPEHTPLAEGEPEPVLDTFDTGPIDLGTLEAQALIAASSSEAKQEPPAEGESESESDSESSGDDFEIDTLEELDDEELEIVEVEDEDEEAASGESDTAPPPPPPPPPRRPPAEAKAPPPPPKSDNSVDIDGLLAELKGE